MLHPSRLPVSNREFLHQLIRRLSGPTDISEVVKSLFNYSKVFVPDRLYRYRECGKTHSFSDIEQGLITITSASEFDDVHDTTMHDTGKIEHVADMAAIQKEAALAVLSAYVDRFNAIDPSNTFQQVVAFAESIYEKPEGEIKTALSNIAGRIKGSVDIALYSEALRRQQMITCLCENGNSDYMWKNYGGNGSGYLIEYKSRELYNIDLHNKKVPMILPVVYSCPLPDTYLLAVSQAAKPLLKEIVGDGTFMGLQAVELIKCVFFKRPYPYALEEEWRLTLAPQEAERDEIRIFRTARPSRLIAGDSMSLPDRQKLNKCAELYGISVDERPKR